MILTMHDVSLKPVPVPSSASSKDVPSGQLLLEGTVKTYRYLDDEEAAAIQRKSDVVKPGAKPDSKPGTKGN